MRVTQPLGPLDPIAGCVLGGLCLLIGIIGVGDVTGTEEVFGPDLEVGWGLWLTTIAGARSRSARSGSTPASSRSPRRARRRRRDGPYWSRTSDLLRVKQALSQLS
jgi:hypothetical protein